MNNLYHKINGPFKRDMESKTKHLLMWNWAVDEFEMLREIEWVGHEKIDGTNIRVMYDGLKVTFGGRTDNAQIPKPLLDFLEGEFTYDKMHYVFPEICEESPVVVYGEGFGHKIQSGGKYVNGERLVSFICFDIKIGSWWLTDDAVKGISSKLGVEKVPLIRSGTLDELFDIVREGLKSKFGDFYAEGLVAKPKLQLFTRSGHRVITKIKHKDFYMK